MHFKFSSLYLNTTQHTDKLTKSLKLIDSLLTRRYNFTNSLTNLPTSSLNFNASGECSFSYVLCLWGKSSIEYEASIMCQVSTCF